MTAPGRIIREYQEERDGKTYTVRVYAPSKSTAKEVKRAARKKNAGHGPES